MKEENTQTVELEAELEFDGFVVKFIKFDLEHINRGWNKEANDYNDDVRSGYKAEDVVEFFEQFSYYCIEWEDGHNKFEVEVKGKKYFRYVAFVTDYDSDEQRKIVIDILKVFSNEGIIVTIY